MIAEIFAGAVVAGSVAFGVVGLTEDNSVVLSASIIAGVVAVTVALIANSRKMNQVVEASSEALSLARGLGDGVSQAKADAREAKADARDALWFAKNHLSSYHHERRLAEEDFYERPE